MQSAGCGIGIGLVPSGLTVQAGGYMGIITAAIAWYIAFAELINEVWFRGRVSNFSLC